MWQSGQLPEFFWTYRSAFANYFLLLFSYASCRRQEGIETISRFNELRQWFYPQIFLVEKPVFENPINKVEGSFRFSCLLDVIQIHFNDRTHFRGLPMGFFRFFWPSVRQMINFTRLRGLLKTRERCQKHFTLTFPIIDLSDRSAIGVLNCRRPGYTDSSVKIMCGR